MSVPFYITAVEVIVRHVCLHREANETPETRANNEGLDEGLVVHVCMYLSTSLPYPHGH
jgi:hypothetical protein